MVKNNIFFYLVLFIFFSLSNVNAVSIDGDAWKVGTSTNTLELSENLEIGIPVNREAIASITSSSYIDSAELPSTLAEGVVSNSKGDVDYNQRLYFEDTTTGYVFFTEDDSDVTADFLYFQNGKQIARYELEFTTSLESDIDDSKGSATASGTYLTDLEDVNIQMIQKTYTIVQARRLTSAGGDIKLILMSGVVKDTLLEGETKTYHIDGKDYETTLDYVDSIKARFTVNGETSRLLKDGDTDRLSDGTEVGISEILYQDYAGGIHSATFFLGAQKIELRDDNIRNTASSNELKVSDETIDGANVIIEGTDDNTTFKVDKIIINMSADDDYYVPAGGKLSENPELSEPQLLFTENWDILYLGLESIDMNEIKINPEGSDDYELQFVDGSGDVVSLPLVNVVTGSTIRFGDDDDSLIVQENKTIKKDDYFILVNDNKEDGKRSSYALRYRGADKSTADNPVIKFDNLGSGERIQRPYSLSSTSITGIDPHGGNIYKIGEIKLGGSSYNIYHASSTASNDYDIFVDLDADGTHSSDRVSLNSKFGARIDIINNTQNQVTINISTVNRDHYDDLKPHSFVFDITSYNGEGRLSKNIGDNHNWRTPDDETNVEYAYSSMGAKATYYTPTSDPQTLTIEYPREQRAPLVYITDGESFSSTEVKWCGNNHLDEGEECDDGNDIFTDGCSPDCKIQPTFEELVQRVIELENQNCSVRLNLLEQWKSTIANTIQVIQDQLSYLFFWLHFQEYDEEGLCYAIENECDGTSNCVDECNQDDVGCSGSEAKWHCEMQPDGCYDKVINACPPGTNCDNGACVTSCISECSLGSVGCQDIDTKWHCQLMGDGCYDKMLQDCSSNEYCEDGICYNEQSTEGEVIFRTNVNDGTYYDCTLQSDCWIVIDFDEDVSLDGLGFDGKSSPCRTSVTVVGQTPEGFDVYDYGSSYRLGICNDENQESRFSTRRTSLSFELSQKPTEPYASNEQEVYGSNE